MRSGRELLLRLGEILHLSSSRNLIVKMEGATPPLLGSRVFDERLKAVGFVADIFGRTSSPYLSIKPAVKSPTELVGKTVDAQDTKKR